MKGLLFLFYSIFSFTYGAKFITELRRISKLEEQLKAGNYSRYVAAKNQMRASTGTQAFTDYYDLYYLGTVIIGTAAAKKPDQQFNMLMDTGTANVWVVSAYCFDQGCGSCISDYTRHLFFFTQSLTFSYTPRTFQYPYDDTINVSGELVNDRFIFGGLTTNQTFGLVEQADSGFCSEPVDGVFGMAFPILNNGNGVPPIQNALPQLTQPIFTIFMGLQTDPSQGRIVYGDLDYDNCDSEVIYKSLSRAAFWQFTLDSVSIGSYTYNTVNRMEAISDSGSAGIVTPRAVFFQIVAQVGGFYSKEDQTYYVPCTTVDSLPTLYVTVNGRNLDIPPQMYTLNYNDVGDNKCWLAFDCMDSNGFSEPSWILGDTFIRSWCQTYDIGQQRIGFSFAKNRPRQSACGQLSLITLLAVTVLKFVF